MKDTLLECFKLYRDKDFMFYGTDEDNGKRIVGKYNRGKINPKEPDLRLYYVGDDKEFLSLWCKVSQTGRKYLIGNNNGLCYVGLINLNRLDDREHYITICIKLNA